MSTDSKNEVTLEQSNFGEGKWIYVLQEAHLIWRIESRAISREERLPLHLFSPDPIRLRRMSLKDFLMAFFWLGIFFAYFAVTVHYFKSHPEASRASFAWNIAGTFAVFIYLASRRFFITARERLHFYNRYTGKPVISLLYGKPSPEVFQSFIEAMKTRIRKTLEMPESKQDPSIAMEIQRLYELKEKNILTLEEFEKAKKELIDSLGQKKIGF